MKSRKEIIEEAARERYQELVNVYGGYQIFIKGAEWADANPKPESDIIIDLIHQRSIAFDYGREQSENLAIANVMVETLESVRKLEVEIENQLREKLATATEALEHLNRELNNKQGLEPDGPNHKLIATTLQKIRGSE